MAKLPHDKFLLAMKLIGLLAARAGLLVEEVKAEADVKPSLIAIQDNLDNIKAVLCG